jgi:transposase InsO family protein
VAPRLREALPYREGYCGERRGRFTQRGLPESITVDHGTEFMSHAVEAWAFYRGVKLDFTRPGKPTDNAHIESFIGWNGADNWQDFLPGFATARALDNAYDACFDSKE